METLVHVVGSYRERDKLIRLCQYALRFMAGTERTQMGRRFGIVATELGACRAVLRLFDDIPMLAYTLHYGTGSKEKNAWLRCLELLSNAANQLYYPLEHVAWFANKQLVNRDAGKWGAACLVAWAVSLMTEIVKAITAVKLIRKAQYKLRKEIELEARKERDSAEMSMTIKNQIKSLKVQELDNYLAFIENLADFINAINWLPPGFLWSRKFSNTMVGGFGFISSLMKMYRLHNPA